MSDACSSFGATAYMWLWYDEAAAPYGTGLSAFDLVDPRGEWRMWIADDASGDEGFTTHRFQLEMTTRPRAATAWSTSQLSVSEGSAEFLTVSRSGASACATGAVTVTSTVGTASAGDFEPISETLTFAAGEVSRTNRLVAPSTVEVTVPPSDGATAGGTDVRAPETSITKAPKATTQKPRAKVIFVADEAGARFECRLDKRRWKTCPSPTRLKNLAPGRHKFRVRAIDLAGNVEVKAAVVRWRVLG